MRPISLYSAMLPSLLVLSCRRPGGPLAQQLPERVGRRRVASGAPDELELGGGQGRQAMLAIDDDHAWLQVALRQGRDRQPGQHGGAQALLAGRGERHAPVEAGAVEGVDAHLPVHARCRRKRQRQRQRAVVAEIVRRCPDEARAAQHGRVILAASQGHDDGQVQRIGGDQFLQVKIGAYRHIQAHGGKQVRELRQQGGQARTHEIFRHAKAHGAGDRGTLEAPRQGIVRGQDLPEAIADAKENAKRNGIGNVEFLCGDAAAAAADFAAKGLRPDVICVDPPRKGLSPEVVAAAASMVPQRIVYVSCDPATLARDVKLFAQEGYCAVRAAAVDMFPGTANVETVVLLSHKKSRQLYPH